ncbi:D-glycero-beta-D-manno-heptose 1-phosphate adenylyltransferase [Lachnospiraceae bacterium]|nr:D-glycero-beta-D-manno-heptose 1-phosphate adenylyltransferase [Lachnospiraceae bacterium]
MSLLNKIESKSILVIGDVMLDTYYNGEICRISPEAPVPVFRKKSERSVLGGAANVASNLAAVRQKVFILTVVGGDENGKKILQYFSDKNINTELVMQLNRDTTVKVRFLASNNQQIMRLDIEDTEEITADVGKVLLSRLEKEIGKFQIIVISDYLKGLLSYDLMQGILEMAKDKGIPVIVDVKGEDAEKYRNAYLLKPNLKELQDLTNMQVETKEGIVKASSYLRERCGCKYVLTTCGAKGMILTGDNYVYAIPAVGKDVFDVTGAGDTVIAYVAACIANGFRIEDSVDIANFAAGIQVAKAGTSDVSIQEVREYLVTQKGETAHKILKSDAIQAFRDIYKDKKIVFTNGCFDILHIGHIRYLKQAALLGDILIVGLNSDASVKRLKGAKRPVNNQEDRAELLCALSFVNYVAVFGEDTPYELINMLQPDVLVKGGDYDKDDVVGKDVVEARGGSLVLIPYVEGKSTTGIIDKIRR